MELLYDVLYMAGTGLFTAVFLTILSRIGLFPMVIISMQIDEEN